ncbi:MAG: glycogen debranching N-terminal domain-containing protein [bacterium]|jgi:glycogen debranching enzyme
MVEDVIQVQEHFYILATSSPAVRLRRVLKQGETFAVFDQSGDIRSAISGEHGLFHEGTRFLSQSELRMAGGRPLLLSSAIKEDNFVLTVDLMNPDITRDSEVILPRGTLHLLRSKFLWSGVCYESVRFRNYGMAPVAFEFTFRFDADFADIFEVRGMKRTRKGRIFEPRVENGTLVLSYEGLDGVMRRTLIRASPEPLETTRTGFRYSVQLEPRGETTVFVTTACETQYAPATVCPVEKAAESAAAELEQLRKTSCRITSSNEQFNEWVNRSMADLHMMVTHTGDMLYPYAGVPWYSTVFGRDGIITAFEYLWVNPTIARGVLSYLALTQADDLIPEQDAEPGKILHEQRGGEMAALGEHPFLHYYGTVDATPLFVTLAGAYYRRTGDLDTIRKIWPAIRKALVWIDAFGDRDGDGFVEYARVSEHGLVQQGWKDSRDSVFHADGAIAEPPIALCEVQGYVYAAKRAASMLASALGFDERAIILKREAEDLRDRFQRVFWDEELGTYVLALDGRKRPCRVVASNAGHCLLTGIASREHAARVASVLMGPEMFSGWGIRTLSTREVRYNPMSYHNGSVWPHDNALIASGLASYGHQDAANRIMAALFDAAIFIDDRRLPELFCGFTRRPAHAPTLYPVACSPQAWASGAVFLLIQACLGLSIDATKKQIRFRRSRLPEFMTELVLHNLVVGDASVDLALQRQGDDVTVNLLRREGDVELWTVK